MQCFYWSITVQHGLIEDDYKRFGIKQTFSSLWANTSDKNIQKLQLVQNFTDRIILGNKQYDHISAGSRKLQWLPVRHLILYGLYNDIQGQVMGLVLITITLPAVLKRSDIHTRNTRSCNNLNIPKYRIKTVARVLSRISLPIEQLRNRIN